MKNLASACRWYALAVKSNQKYIQSSPPPKYTCLPPSDRISIIPKSLGLPRMSITTISGTKAGAVTTSVEEK
jgi:hypothetical protein